MCRFLFVGVSEIHHPFLVQELTQAGLAGTATVNAAIRAAFPAGDVVVCVTHGGCSCDISGHPRAHFDEAAERQKLRKKGWSAAKVDRAILGKRPNRKQFNAFRDLIARVVRAARSTRIAAHWFSGDVRTEAVQLRSGGVLRLDDYIAHEGAFPDDLVHDLQER